MHIVPFVTYAADVTLAWDAAGKPVTGYKVYYGTTSGDYDYNVNIGNYTSCTISGLEEGVTYYFAVTAYSSFSESDFSNEISTTVHEETEYGIPLPDAGTYGFSVPEGKTARDNIDFSFSGEDGDATITYEVYDIDSEGEVEILINGEVVGNVPTTGDNAWSSRQVVSLPDDLVNDGTINVITFNNTYNPPNFYKWGVRNVTIGIPLPDSGTYGHSAPGGITLTNEADFSFGGTIGDVEIAYEMYDIDIIDEVEILINGIKVSNVSTTGNNAWGGVQTVILPDNLVNDSSTNILTFNNTYNPDKTYFWGVRNVGFGP
jgi:hypothetical protein